MQQATGLLAALALTLLPSVAAAAGGQHFDGQWQTTVSCLDSRGGLGYSYRFLGVVKDGVYHGLHGTLGQPGSLQVVPVRSNSPGSNPSGSRFTTPWPQCGAIRQPLEFYRRVKAIFGSS